MVLPLIAMGAGLALNAYGQNQGARAMQRANARHLAEQRGFDQQVAERTDHFLDGLTPQALFGGQFAGPIAGDLDADAHNVLAAVDARAQRRGGGGAGRVHGREAAGQAQQAQSGVLARALRDGLARARLEALLAGQADVNARAAEMGHDTGLIRDAARRRASLYGGDIRRAGRRGSGARQAGTLLSALGQGSLYSAMAQPMAPASQDVPWWLSITEQPAGGWAEQGYG